MTKKEERIAKTIAAAGVCSRREAERLILDGRVKVNGVVLKTPAFLTSEQDQILIDDQPLPGRQKRRLWCYHKPAGLITTHRDPGGRPTVFEKLPKYLPRVVSVGRLDFNSEGLLLLTTDGALARALEHPSRGWTRRYRVRVHGDVTPTIIERLKQGITVKGIHYAPCELEIERKQGSNTWVTITLKEGKNREIRNMMAFFGLPVTRLIRVSYGPFQLGSLAPGEVREMTGKAIADLA